MTQEEKELLLKDLSARLPYGVKCKDWTYGEDDRKIDTIQELEVIFPKSMQYRYSGIHAEHSIKRIKPYLRTMSSMTEEEINEFEAIFDFPFDAVYDTITKKTTVYNSIVIDKGYCVELDLDGVALMLDWLNSHHFDYRGLIEKGLALEAPQNMYK